MNYKDKFSKAISKKIQNNRLQNYLTGNCASNILKNKFLKQDLITMILLFAAGCLGIFAADLPSANDDGLIRVHIFANSDSCYDQTVKTIVKDAVMEYVGELTANCRNSAETESALRSHLSEINAIAGGIAENYGCTAQTSYGVFSYSQRIWQGETMPPGNYESLRIILGKGEGHNWFCVLYPDLCLENKMGELKKTEADFDNAAKNNGEQYDYENNTDTQPTKVNIRLGSFFLRFFD